MTRELRPVEGATRHLVGSDGSVYGVRGRLMVPSINSRGYLAVSIYTDARERTTQRVHQLVAAAFLGTRPPGMQINHINGNKSDNRVENLEYVTRSENVHHSYDVLGAKKPKGVINGNARLTPEIVQEIRRKRADGFSSRALADLYAIDRSHVNGLVRRRFWDHVA